MSWEDRGRARKSLELWRGSHFLRKALRKEVEGVAWGKGRGVLGTVIVKQAHTHTIHLALAPSPQKAARGVLFFAPSLNGSDKSSPHTAVKFLQLSKDYSGPSLRLPEKVADPNPASVRFAHGSWSSAVTRDLGPEPLTKASLFTSLGLSLRTWKMKSSCQFSPQWSQSFTQGEILGSSGLAQCWALRALARALFLSQQDWITRKPTVSVKGNSFQASKWLSDFFFFFFAVGGKNW
jgi:hypothetical protein